MLGALTAQEATGQGVDAARATLEKWVEARQLLSKEKKEWELGKETLRDRIDVLRRESAAMQKRIDDAETSIAEADKKRGELTAEDEQRKTSEAQLLQRVGQLERTLLELLPRLPDPLRQQIAPVSQMVPFEPAQTKLRPDERLRNVLFIGKQIHKWNREITLKSEVRTQLDGSSVEVTVIYVGIGQGYYASGDGKVAGTGTATATGWVWTPNNNLAPEVAAAIAILKNEKVAAFVRLPVQIL